MTPDRLPELDRTTWPELRDRIASYAPEEAHPAPRSYPGYPRVALDPVGPRLWPPLDRVLRSRRSSAKLGAKPPTRKALSRLLYFAHGCQDAMGRGPTPSSGGLQSLELYVATSFQACRIEPAESGIHSPSGRRASLEARPHATWLPDGVHHYDRVGHYLSQVADRMSPDEWRTMIPSLTLVEGGELLWIIVGDGERIEKKYGPRGARFLLLEAGHLMQNLCLLSASLGLVTTPLGGFLERDIARCLRLPKGDMVLYCGVGGA